MIEVEKKFQLEEAELLRIKKNASFIKKKIFTDVYFDTKEYLLTLQNQWLRKRGTHFELKVGLQKGRSSIDQYREITNEEEISTFLSLPKGSLEKTLKENGFLPFCSYTTTRETYRLNDLTLDMDVVDFGDMVYRVLECELIVSSQEEIPLAEQKITQLLQEYNVSMPKLAPGKVAIYLAHKRKEHYLALVQAGVLQKIDLSCSCP